MKKFHFSALAVLAGVAFSAMLAFSGELQWTKPEQGRTQSVQVHPAVQTKTAAPVSLEFPVILAQNVEEKTVVDAAGQTDVTVAKPAAAPLPKSSVLKKTPCDYELKSITAISHDIRRKGNELPEECPQHYNAYSGRHFDRTCYQWKASNLCTKAAYFEDVQLDRYGHSSCPAMEPIISGAKFFATVPLLPYYAGVMPPNECVYTLGHYRVGNCSPYMIQPFPISFRGALFEAGAVGGAIAILP
ncbi:MAG: hypothetical protein LBT46_11535 [Planctomycetaceae bacterium]|jgi:hypothetical protein|nr:hypothetical protein [Planctomycetaceae bacterium]